MSSCHEISEDPDLGQNYEGISKQLLGFKANRHIVFYRVLSESYVEITRILHERMDLKKRIAE
ncbi:MAG: type II toxin-antitoxin system RelE/ParE family toxin [Gelidibacter sp.]|uniref:type II toxin-antitoxin system RelE/ParE family toxin n=1 Tax=Gelidibacter sp. TaxID=2018083 RepID=UPI0032665A0D